MRAEQKNTFDIGLNLDDDPKTLKPGEYIYALNLRNTATGHGLAVENLYSNREVFYDLPGVVNKCIGRYEDKVSNTVIYFVFNDQGFHRILRYRPQKGIEAERIDTVVEDGPDSEGNTVLNFHEDVIIHSIDLVGDLLYWTAGDNPQRKINIAKSTLYNKRIEFHVYFGTSFTLIPGTNGYRIRAVRVSDGLTVQDDFNATDANLDDMLDALVQYFNVSSVFSQYFLFYKTGDYVKVLARDGNFGVWDITLTSLDNLDQPYWFAPINYYPLPIVEHNIDAIKYPPNCEPTLTLNRNADKAINYIRGQFLQFRTRFIYDDFEETAWSPISQIVVPEIGLTNDINDISENFVTIDYTDDGKLLTLPYRTMVRKVQIAVRFGENDPFKLITTLEANEVIGTYDFYNDGIYAAIASAEQNLLYHNVPLTSQDQEFVTDRLFYLNNEIGFDPIPIDVEIGQTFGENVNDKSGLYTIKGRAVIINLLKLAGGSNMDLQQDINTTDHVFGGLGPDGDTTPQAQRALQEIPLDGFTFYLEGTSYFGTTVQSANPIFLNLNGGISGDFFTQDFEIHDVPPGVYILRVASHRVHDDLDNPDIYYIGNKDLSWQKTSTTLERFCGALSRVDGVYELVINLPVTTTVNPVYDLSTVGLPNSGVTIINDLTYYKNAVNNNFDELFGAISGYLIDDLDATVPNEKENVQGALRMEQQRITQYLFLPGPVTAATVGPEHTDHNGFLYATSITFRNASPFVYRLLIQGVSSLVIKDLPNNMWIGGIHDPDALILSSDAEKVASSLVEVVAYNYSADVNEDFRTRIFGKILNQLGNPLAGININFTRTGRYDVSDQNGDYSIFAYASAFEPLPPNNRNDDVLIYNTNGNFGTTISSPTQSVNPLTFTEKQVNNRVVSITTQIYSGWKRGGRRQFALLYMDRGNRSSTALKTILTEIYTPFFTEDLNKYFPTLYAPGTFMFGQAYISWLIKHFAPDWATHYKWMVTKDEVYVRYLQFVANDVKYVKTYSGDEPKFTSYGNSDAKVIFLDVSNLGVYRNENPDSKLGYTYLQGDKVRLIADGDGNFYRQFYEVDVLGQLGDNIIVKALDSLPELSSGVLFEVYTPRPQLDNKLYYELPGCYETVDVEVEEFDPVTQTTVTVTKKGHSVLSGAFDFGDAYLRYRDMPVNDGDAFRRYKYYVESASLTDSVADAHQSIGRPNFYIKESEPFNRKLFRVNNIAFSDKYLSGTTINGLNAFQPLNNQDIDKDYGPITKSLYNGNVLLVLCENRSFSVYVNKVIYQDQTGQEVIALSDEVIGTVRQLLGNYGCSNPESVIENESVVKWWDAKRMTPVQYAQNGLNALAKYKANTYFARKAQQCLTLSNSQNKVIATYNEQFGEYMITFPEIGPIAKETFVYNDDRNRWTSWYSFTPEMFCQNNIGFVSFQDGKIFIHDVTAVRNTFYGTAFNSEIKTVCNIFPSTEKIFKNLSIEANRKWQAPTITTPETEDNPGGQLSELLYDDFELIDSVYWSDFLNNKLTPNFTTQAEALINGEGMMGLTMRTDLESDSTQPNVLFAVNFHFIINELSEK